MAHYATRIAKGSAIVKRKPTETVPEDNGATFDPMKSLKFAQQVRARSQVRGNNAKGK